MPKRKKLPKKTLYVLVKKDGYPTFVEESAAAAADVSWDESDRVYKYTRVGVAK